MRTISNIRFSRFELARLVRDYVQTTPARHMPPTRDRTDAGIMRTRSLLRSEPINSRVAFALRAWRIWRHPSTESVILDLVRFRFLIVDDHDDSRAMMVETLRMTGEHEIAVAKNGMGGDPSSPRRATWIGRPFVSTTAWIVERRQASPKLRQTARRYSSLLGIGYARFFAPRSASSLECPSMSTPRRLPDLPSRCAHFGLRAEPLNEETSARRTRLSAAGRGQRTCRCSDRARASSRRRCARRRRAMSCPTPT